MTRKTPLFPSKKKKNNILVAVERPLPNPQPLVDLRKQQLSFVTQDPTITEG